MKAEPIIKCRRCRGEGVLTGAIDKVACSLCNGTGLRAVSHVPDKQCSCGALYDAVAWQKLRYVGLMEDEVEVIELRDCRECHSTIAIVLERHSSEAPAA